VAHVLAGGVVGGFALLTIPGLVNAQEKWALPQRLARQLQSTRTRLFHGPLGFCQEMMEGLRIGLGGLGQTRQGLALGLGHQAEFQARELLELADIGKHGSVVGTIVVNGGDCGGRFTGFRHGGVSFLRLRHAYDTHYPQTPCPF
jgi:hypothetical protein